MGVTSAANHFWQLHRQIFLTECILTGSLHLAVCLVSFTRAARSRTERANFFLPIAIRLAAGLRSSGVRVGQRQRRNVVPRSDSLSSSHPSQANGIWRTVPSQLCAPAFSHRSHCDWAHNFPYLQPRYCWTYARHNHSGAVRFDSKEISHYKCPL